MGKGPLWCATLRPQLSVQSLYVLRSTFLIMPLIARNMQAVPVCDEVTCFAILSKAVRKGPYFITLVHGKLIRTENLKDT